ncbi:hypothetical protein GCM10011504_25260 [Siccirubricoccus deserti]|uniref:Uncharacterized protein n=1 Tax=Siccirubricoccus deserti TaxID=2013562 RepID=A0A9X0QYU6_9PROT|nr:DUF6212 domain-containing protein [Siccirubricoccus deserti]MBC4016140.1 hypothetical protein [Siccirubricoccus deserti]GGC45735.1 hypothetical protein GCM10011504_25260 [Siccirubricoccus deserti]
MTPRIEPALLGEFHDAAAPLLLADAALPEVVALALPGLALWLVDGEGRLHRPGGDPARATLPLAAAPAEALAMVAAEETDLAVLRSWWSAPGLPPLLLAANGPAALPALAPLLAAALQPRAAQAAGLQRALVAARQEAERLQEAMQALLLHAGPPAAQPAPVLARAGEPAATAAVAPRDGRLALGQALGLPLSGVTALALHLEAAAGTLAALRLRLHGAESGRILGAWLVPGGALASGWQQFDLPAPLGPLREGALLEVVAETSPEDVLRLSLEDRRSEAPVVVAGGPAQDRALAVRVWTAPAGRRFIQPLHWDAEAIDLPLAPAGVAVALPEQLFAAARLPLGRVEARALGQAPARLVATLAGGEAALVVLPAVPLNGLDLLTAELAPGLGDAAGLEAALWLQPADAVLASLGDLSLEPPGARWSGWRSPRPGEPLRITLALPLAAARHATVALALRNAGPTAADQIRVEFTDLVGRRVAQPVGGKAPAPVRLAAVAPGAGVPSLAAVRLEDSLVLGGGSYRHLDIWLEGVRAGEYGWPRLRFKFVLDGDAPALEFRARPDWPPLFGQWPEGNAAMRIDQYGPYLRLTEAALAEGLVAGLAEPRDQAMLTSVLRLLPMAVATVARDATAEPAEYDMLLGKARRLAAGLPG